ncbi:MAG: tryptophan 7-halogenase, partial [Planctomycetes bacterium]|nr:tryptophan 7-halogenase [Planctomycetota bacterium]
MITVQADVAIIGAGFGGSLTALLVERIGLKPVLIEQGSHPRFAIGESSTPLADLTLRALAERYDLPRLVPLTRYGSWRRTYPDVMRGLKRGFSYFHHQAGEPFVPCADHANELLVAASPDDEHADTHWLRADVDHFFVREVQAAGIDYFDRTTLEDIAAGAGARAAGSTGFAGGLTRSAGWRLSGRRDGEAIEVTAEFVIDASGAGRVLERCLGIANDVSDIKTNSRTIYSHFRGVRRWRDVYEQAGGRSADHPYECDAAALHHVFDGGWMWVLRFDNDLVSAGFVLDQDRYPLNESVPPDREWASWLERFPSIAAQFESAAAHRPFERTDRLQRCAAQIVGENWAMLPHTAGFLDPLHSSGIALTLSGIERIIAALEAGSSRAERLAAYQESLRREIAVMDQIIHGCYQCFDRFELMTSFAMYYFAGAISSEHRRRDGSHNVADGFLMSHDAAFRAAVRSGYDELCDLASRTNGGGARASEFPSRVAESIAAYNPVGLCDPDKCNMYP